MDPNKIGRFDKSFVVRMIRDFFLSVLVLMVLQIDFGFLSRLMRELDVLQDKMKGITESSQRLLKRLTVRQDAVEK